MSKLIEAVERMPGFGTLGFKVERKDVLDLIRQHEAQGGECYSATETFAWLLERTARSSNQPEYLMVRGSGCAQRDDANFDWTTTAHHALRFSRRIDAALFASTLFAITNHLPVRVATDGFRHGDMRPQPVQHGFVQASPMASERSIQDASPSAQKTKFSIGVTSAPGVESAAGIHIATDTDILGPDLVRIWSIENLAWCRENRSGYTLKESEAGLFGRAVAERIVAEANGDRRKRVEVREMPVEK